VNVIIRNKNAKAKEPIKVSNANADNGKSEDAAIEPKNQKSEKKTQKFFLWLNSRTALPKACVRNW
jgi:hypothetical protein